MFQQQYVMLDQLKNRFFFKALQKRQLKVKREIRNRSFDDSVSFLLLFDCTTEERYNQFTRIYAALQLQGKTVHAIGFHGLHITPQWCMPSLHVEMIGKNDITKTGIPKSKTIDDLLLHPFDVLIDLTSCLHQSILWITTLSAAQFKIGASAEKCPQLYDLTIDSDKIISQEEVMRLAHDYLNMLKNKPV